MTYCVLLQVVLLSFAMIKTVPVSSTADGIRNKFDPIIIDPFKWGSHEEMKTIMQSSDGDGNTTVEADKAVQSFLWTAMLNYSMWLGDGNNAEPDPAEIVLNTTGLPSDQAINLDANIHLRTNQYKANHSTAGLTIPIVNFKVSERIVSVMRTNWFRELLVTFGGDYSVNGSFNVNSSLKIPFSGDGHWELKGKYYLEYIGYDTYSVDTNGYVDLPNASISFLYVISWEHAEFQDLKFDYKEDEDDSWMPTVKQELANFYGQFLANNLTSDEFQEHNQPRRLLHKYLQETLLTKRLEDIISDWEPEPEPEPGHGGKLVASSWVVLGTVAAYYCNV